MERQHICSAISISLVALLMMPVICWAAGAEKFPPELCVSGSNVCIEWPREREELPPNAMGKPYVFSSDSGSTISVGVLPADGIAADFSPTIQAPDIRLAVQQLGVPHSRQPIALSIQTNGGEQAWRTEIPATRLSQLRRLKLPPGRYFLRVSADHYRTLERSIEVTSGKSQSIGKLVLQANPVLIGHVVSKESGDPIANASVTDANHTTLAFGNATGEFEIELTTDELHEIVVCAPSRAPKRVALSQTLTDRSLGDIALSKSGGLAIRVTMPTRPKLEVELTDNTDPNSPKTVATKSLLPGELEVRFDDLESSDFVLVVSGPEALQRIALPVEIKPGQLTEQTVEITPTDLHIHTRIGDVPAPAAHVDITNTTTGWKTSLVTNADADYDGHLWQAGMMLTAVRTGSMAQPHVFFKEVESSTNSWDIVIPDYRVTGTTVDRLSGSPVAGARLMLRTRTKDSAINVEATSAADGRFEFEGVNEGEQTLTVTNASGYLRPQPITFTMNQTRRRVDQRIELLPGVNRRLSVRTTSGTPCAGATVYVTVDGSPVGREQADGNGEVTLSLPARVSPVVYAFPREGSFAIARLTAADVTDSSPATMTVSPGAAALILSVRDQEEKPIGGVRFLIRYDHEFMVPDVLLTEPIGQPTAESGDAVLPRIPPGYYEIWPYRNPQEASAIIAAGGEAPMRMGLQVNPGENRATLLLRKRGVGGM